MSIIYIEYWGRGKKSRHSQDYALQFPSSISTSCTNVLYYTKINKFLKEKRKKSDAENIQVSQNLECR